MAKMTKAEMTEFIKEEQAELAGEIAAGRVPRAHAKFVTDGHNLTLAELAEEDGHADLAQPLRREIGD